MNKCCAKQALVDELKDLEMDACFDYELEPNKGKNNEKKIIDTKHTTIVATIKLQRVELDDLEEGKCLFHL